MSLIGDLLGGRLRREMQERVDQILKSGDDWRKKADELITALNKLSDCIEKSEPNQHPSSRVAKATRQLTTKTENMTNALQAHSQLLKDLISKIP